jgi:hypothetical protein
VTQVLITAVLEQRPLLFFVVISHCSEMEDKRGGKTKQGKTKFYWEIISQTDLEGWLSKKKTFVAVNTSN